jgi:hypothetical protein
MKQPVDHILRPRLPWRPPDEAPITECGYDALKVPTVTRATYFERLKEMGQQRCALFTCMTCADTARRWGTWEDDPRVALEREIVWEHGGYWTRHRSDRGERLRDELTAIAQLIETHRAEFDGELLAIAERRAWNAKKEALKHRPKPVPVRPL